MDPNEIVGDCSQIQQLADLGSGVPIQLGFTSTLDNDVGPNGYLKVEVIFAGIGWVAWGFSQGGMVPGYSVVGVPGVTPTVYYMEGKDPSQVNPASSSLQTLQNASVTQNATHTSLTFIKRLNESPEFNINGEGSNVFLVAWGFSNVFSYHYGNRRAFTADLKYCVKGKSSGDPLTEAVSVTSSSLHQQLYGAHGIFAAAAWAIFAPLAIGASLLRRVFISSDLPSLWFRLHMSLNLMVFILTTFAFAFAVRAISLTADARHFQDIRHRKTGLFVMIILFVQTMSGLLRPHPPHPKTNDEEETDGDKEPEQALPRKSRARVAFEVGHRVLGFFLLFFAWWQVQSGLKLYSSDFDEKNLTGAFWGVTGVLSGIVFVLYLVHFRYC
jgi:hypothetical protein